MGKKTDPAHVTFGRWLFGHGVMKRTILVPIYALLSIAFGLSWFMSVRGSRSAVFLAADELALSAAQRAESELHGRLSLPAAIVESNAALLASAGWPLREDFLEALPRAFLVQLEAHPFIDLIAMGFMDGEYVEAQRVSDGELRMGRAGRATGGELVSYRIGEAGRPEEEGRWASYDPRGRPWYRSALGRMGLSWTGPYAYVSTGEKAIAAVRVVRRSDGMAVGVSSVSLRLSDFARFMDSMEEIEGGFAALLDRDGAVLASGGSIQDLKAFAEEAITIAVRDDGKVHRGRFGGRRFRVVSVPCLTGYDLEWSVAVAVPEDRFLAPLRRKDFGIALIFLAAFVAALCLAYLVASNLAKPLRLLSAAAAELGASADLGSAPFSPSPDGGLRQTLAKISLRSDEIGRLADAFGRLDARLSATFASLTSSLTEKEILLREVHHRVKNNLQIVSSLLSLRSGDVDDPVLSASLEEIRDRVHAMSLVHETIYSSGEFAAVPMDDYLHRVVRSLSAYDRLDTAVSFSVHADGVGLPLEKAIPCALVVVELATNAFKHAFAGRESGTVAVSLAKEDGLLALAVEDDGIGMRDVKSSGGMGRTIVEALAAQLGGALSVETGDRGTRVALRFPERG